MKSLLYITWSVAPVIGHLGAIELRWYGLLFALGLFLAGWYVYIEFKKQGYTQSQFESLLILLFFGIFIGARLAHCLFYEPEYYLSHPLEIVLPVTIFTDGHWEFSGYHGLASHGGATGLAIALWIFCKRYKVKFWPLSDILAIGTMLAGGFIRLGNLCNSEIIGSPTSVPWAMIFPLHDQLPRHPAQLYEALVYFALFAVLAYWRHKQPHRSAGFYFGIVLLVVGIFRFCIEFLKEVQSPFEQNMFINMGQCLSIPLVILGILLLLKTTINENI